LLNSGVGIGGHFIEKVEFLRLFSGLRKYVAELSSKDVLRSWGGVHRIGVNISSDPAEMSSTHRSGRDGVYRQFVLYKNLGIKVQVLQVPSCRSDPGLDR
jgi:hypothetical protein